jgi:polysaccharide lyase family 4-like protein
VAGPSSLLVALALAVQSWPASVGAYEVTAVAEAATLTGVVRFVGAPPNLRPLDVTGRQDVCGDEQPSEALVIGPDRGVRGSVVRIEGVRRGRPTRSDLVIDTAHCAFAPHVSVMMVGARARVKNADPILHNPRALVGRSTLFALAIPGREEVIDVTRRFVEPGIVRMSCGAHPHMSAWLVVHDSPYIATTDEHGAFRIEGIPPGTYRVTMWHEPFRQKGTDRDGRPVYGEPITVSREVTLAKGATASLDFQLSSRKASVGNRSLR